jgi:hypothetical protein
MIAGTFVFAAVISAWRTYRFNQLCSRACDAFLDFYILRELLEDLGKDQDFPSTDEWEGWLPICRYTEGNYRKFWGKIPREETCEFMVLQITGKL